MNKIIISTLFLFIFNYCASFSDDRVQAILPEFKAYIQKVMKDWQMPAVSVGIVYQGKVVFEEAMGVKSVDTQEPVDIHTSFPIASCTKTFLSALLAQLVDEGKIKWKDPVRQYLPTFFIGNEEVSQAFTLEDLVSHQSGLPSFSGDTFWELGFSQQELLDSLAKVPLKRPFKEFYGYQNHLFSVASLVAEKVTGKKIEELFTERFFMPLHMDDASASYEKMIPESWWQRLLNYRSDRGITGWLFPRKQVNAIAPHTFIQGKITTIPFPKELYLFPGTSGVNASISDMNKWLLFQLKNMNQEGGPKISTAEVERLRTPHISILGLKPTDSQFPPSRYTNVAYGIGWFIHDIGVEGKKVHAFGHMGGFSSVRSLILIVPEQQLGIVILSNLGGLRVNMALEALREKFMDLFLKIDDGTDWSTKNLDKIKEMQESYKRELGAMRLQNPRPMRELKLYEGKFKNNLYGTLVVEAKGQQLVFKIRDKVVPVKHWNGDQFLFDAPDLSAAYSSNDVGVLEFGFQKQSKAMVLAINMLREGDQLFERFE